MSGYFCLARYREDQEDQLGALGLVTNVVVLWNTIYMQDALDHLQQSGMSILDDDVVKLSPLRNEHMKPSGIINAPDIR